MSEILVRNKVRILLGWEPLEIEVPDPNCTVLEYLRNERRLFGTKEGCAEGDCGACTIIIGELRENKVFYRAVNACILFLPYLDGKQILTVEHISAGTLTSVQTALITFHGSQCGFCTPGIVMSLLASHINQGGSTRREVDDILAGNLCRCTGYGPIIKAAQYALKECKPPSWGTNTEEIRLKLAEWDACMRPLKILKLNMVFFAPRTVNQLNVFLNEFPHSTIIAGMTDVGIWVTKLGKSLNSLVSLLKVENLNEITVSKNGIEIGAAVTYSDAFQTLVEFSSDFEELLRRIGSTQIRNNGTICGNIANGSPIGDMAPALIALSASIIFCSIRGHRKIKLDDFYIDYGKQNIRSNEFIEKIEIPSIKGFFKCYKVSKRFDQDISAVVAGFQLQIFDQKIITARIAYGGMANRPLRAFLCEKALEGRELTRETIEEAKIAICEDFSPISDARASKEYRTLIACNLIERFFLDFSSSVVSYQLSDRRFYEEEKID